MPTFGETQARAPNIHASHKGQTTTLKPDHVYDARRRHRRYSKGSTGQPYERGSGTRRDPYMYLSAASVSAHYGVVDLWYGHRDRQCYIQINDWLFQVTPEGVIAEDGVLTRIPLREGKSTSPAPRKASRPAAPVSEELPAPPPMTLEQFDTAVRQVFDDVRATRNEGADAAPVFKADVFMFELMTIEMSVSLGQWRAHEPQSKFLESATDHSTSAREILVGLKKRLMG